MLIRCYSMDFFDPQRWRVTGTNASKHFRSLLERESTAVASLAYAETPTDGAQALLSSSVKKPVKRCVGNPRVRDQVGAGLVRLAKGTSHFDGKAHASLSDEG